MISHRLIFNFKKYQAPERAVVLNLMGRKGLHKAEVLGDGGLSTERQAELLQQADAGAVV